MGCAGQRSLAENAIALLRRTRLSPNPLAAGEPYAELCTRKPASKASDLQK
jgi:hypothetical protein